MGFLLNLVPPQYRLVAAAIAVAAIYGAGVFLGWRVESWRWGAADAQREAAIVKEAEKAIETKDKQAAITADVGEKAAAAQVKIQTVTKTIIKKVPVYVTVKADSQCVVPRGFVRLHDAAASGTDLSGVPGAAGQSDDAPSGTQLSTVAGTVADNYGTCHEVSAQLVALQDWIRRQQAVK